MVGGTGEDHSLPLLDGLRGGAALLVVLTHVGFQTGEVTRGPLGAVIARCDVGVAIFFVLSGFLLTRPWAAHRGHRDRVNLRRYAVRRAARILPAYWIALGAVLATTATTIDPVAMASNVLLLQVYTGDLLPGFTQTWSLCTEVAFYAVLPALAPVVVRSTSTRRRGLGVAFGSSLITAIWLWLAAVQVIPRRAGEWLPGHLDWFVLGMVLACAEAHRRTHPQGKVGRAWDEIGARPAALLMVVGASFWVAATPLAGPRTLAPAGPAEVIAKEALYAVIGLGLVLWALTAHERTTSLSRQVLGNRMSQTLGRLSYAVFLWHLLILAGVFTAFDVPLFSGGFWWILGLTLVGSVGVAAVSWRVAEQPFLARVHRAEPRVGQASPPAAR